MNESEGYPGIKSGTKGKFVTVSLILPGTPEEEKVLEGEFHFSSSPY
jgi:hypothetical protein